MPKVRARSNSIKMSQLAPSPSARLQAADEITRETEEENSLMGSQALLLQSSHYSSEPGVTKEPKKRIISGPLIVSICAASLAMLAAGSQYAFSLYGPQLSQLLDLTQSQTSFIAASANTGTYISGPAVGFMVDKNASRPRRFLWSGGIMMALGYSLLALSALYYLPSQFLLLASFNLIVGMGAALAYHSALATNVRNWPVSYRGVAVGVPVAAFGLSAFLYTQLARWNILRFPDTHDLIVPSFLFLMSGASVLMNGLAGIVLRDIRAAVVIEEEDEELEIERIGEDGTLPIGHPLSQASSRSSSVFRRSQGSSSVHSSSESTLKRLVTDPDAVLLAISMFCSIGVGLMYINNVGAIVMALIPPTDLPMKMQSLQVGLISIGSFLGRILSGFASDICWKVFKLNRLIWPLLAAGLSLSGCLLSISMESLDRLTFVTALMGLGYGVMWTSLPVLVGEFFGTTKFASHWGWFQVIPAFGGQFTSLIFGWIVDSEYAKQPQNNECRGNACFSKAFLISAGLCLVSMASSISLFLRRRRRGVYTTV